MQTFSVIHIVFDPEMEISSVSWFLHRLRQRRLSKYELVFFLGLPRQQIRELSPSPPPAVPHSFKPWRTNLLPIPHCSPQVILSLRKQVQDQPKGRREQGEGERRKLLNTRKNFEGHPKTDKEQNVEAKFLMRRKSQIFKVLTYF